MKTTSPTLTPGLSPEVIGMVNALKFIEKALAPNLPPSPEPKQRDESFDTISFFVQRDFSDDVIEVAVEVLDYQPIQQGGTWDEKLGPFIELGDAFYLDGRECVLTELEREAAEMQAIKQIESRPSYEEENLEK